MPEKKRRKNERKDGLIQVQIDLGRDAETGKRIRKYFYGRTKKEAEAKRDAFLEERGLGISERSETLTVLEWANEWLETYKTNVSINTKKNYSSIINTTLKPIHHTRIIDIRHTDLQRIANNLSCYSNSNITKVRNTISGVFNRAWLNKLIPDDPSLGITYPSGSSGSHRALEEWEIEIIRTHWHEHRAGIWFMLMLYCGLRRGEAIALKWSNIDFHKGELTIDSSIHFEDNRPIIGKPKTNAGFRTIPVPELLLRSLRQAKLASTASFVCVSANNEVLSEVAFKRGLNGFKLAMGKSSEKPLDFRPHDLRHTYATFLYDAGVDIKSAQYYLGHTDIKMTMQLYTHLSEQKKKESSDRIEDYFKAWL